MARVAISAVLYGYQCLMVAQGNVAADGLCVAVKDALPRLETVINQVLPTGGALFLQDFKVVRKYSDYDVRQVSGDYVDEEHEFIANQTALLTNTDQPMQHLNSSRRCDNDSIPANIYRKARLNPRSLQLRAWVKQREELMAHGFDIRGCRAIIEFNKLNRTLVNQVRDETHIITTTLFQAIGLNSPAQVLFIDEASQITHHDLVAVLTTNYMVRVVVIIGDTQQLPPYRGTYLKNEFESVLADSALKVFMKEDILGDWCVKLNINYRAHPDLVWLYSNRMYEGRVASHESNNRCDPAAIRFKDIATRGGFKGRFTSIFNRLPEARWFVLNAIGPHIEDQNGSSRLNPTGDTAIVELVEGLLTPSNNTTPAITPQQIGIITMYGADRMALPNALRTRSNQGGPAGLIDVTLLTVDASHGRESDVLIIHLVSGQETPGFITNPNRFNVALSRARHLCFIVANMDFLTSFKYNKNAIVGDWLREDLARRIVRW